MTCLLFYLLYPHNALRFTNHVGEQRNFCKQKCDVPLLVCLSNSTLSAQRSAYFFKTLYGTTFPHTTRLHKFMNNQTLPLRAGCRGRQPLQSFRQIRCAAKSLRSLRIYVLLWDRIAVQIVLLRYFFCLIAYFYMLLILQSAPSRLSPNEALPHTPLGALPLDPTSPPAPSLSVRFIYRFARCLGAALLIPHS